MSYDCRYAGQSHELTVSAPSEFHEVHRLRNGYAREGDPIEVVALRVRASRSSPVALSDLPALGRQAVDGPEVIAEEDSGTWIPPGWRAEVGEAGCLGHPPKTEKLGLPVPPPVPSPPSGSSSSSPLVCPVHPVHFIRRIYPICLVRPARFVHSVRLVRPAILPVPLVPPRLSRPSHPPHPSPRPTLCRLLGSPSSSPDWRASPRRWGRCCVGRLSAPTSRSGWTARRRCSPRTGSFWFRPSTYPSTWAQCLLPSGRPLTSSAATSGRANRSSSTTPTQAGTHLNDVTLVAPCYSAGRLVGWVANRAHHADLGGGAPGSMPADARTIYEEGLRIPPVRLTDDITDLICAASRTPTERRGDLDAQMGANNCGAVRLAEFADAPLRQVTDYGERRMRSALAALPDGVWSFEDALDSTGPEPSQQRPARIAVRVVLEGDSVTFDFTGTDPQRSGNVNAVRAVTVSCVSFVLRCATDPDIPANGGAMRPVQVIAPEGTLWRLCLRRRSGRGT